MAAWKLVKDLNLDLSGLSAKNIQTIIDNLDSGDINAIIADLRKERAKNEKLQKYMELALSIAETVLTKGIPLV
jgi:hypothetical protein